MLYRDAFGFVVRDEDNFNIVCGEFVISINNNDNVSITQYKPSTNAPQAYTATSVDELRMIDAVDGSMAIVSMSGNRWVLNNTVTPFSNEEQHYMLFECDVDRTLYNGIRYGSFGPPAYAIMYTQGELLTVAYGFEGAAQFGVPEGWGKEGYKYCTVYQADQEATNWLNSNGIMTVENVDIKQFLYIRENGEWVYKGEIV